ncbi:MAG: LysM peptidoglycan-binding domain-containing protein [Castellaniella sp.]|nr:LysM peptidoglycan-binding domain-containing protein [Castellaniella sp.]
MGSGTRLIGGLIVAAALAAGSAQAATFGHARLASALGAPLLILVPVSDLTAADLRTLSARPAPAADWARAGLTPPVALDSLSITVGPDVQASARRVLRIQSSQAFSGTLADVLLDVHTATGEQRYQVSLVVPGPVRAEPPAASPSGTGPAAPALGAAAAHTSARRIPTGSITVRPGDTMFSIARRHAVDGVSVYQLMMALQRANPQAFIHQNINLVRAGASLAVPGVADMLSISDAEARRQFVMQTAAFDRLRGRLASGATRVQAETSKGAVSRKSAPDHAADNTARGDRLQLSQGGKTDTADTRTARGHALKDTEARVGQLQDNVQNLNKALQAQGEAASHAAVKGAHAIGDSIDQIASAITEASHEAAAQANAQTAAEARALAAGQSAGADAAGAGAQGAAAKPGASVEGAGAGAASAAASAHAPGGASGANATASSSAGQAAGGAAAANGRTAPDLASALTPEAPAHADALEQQVSKRAEHRASWIQDHLLGVMTALLAVIVFIIAWLLRRANTTRDDSEDSPRVTEAMVREKLQDIDLDLPAQDAAQPSAKS